MPYSPRTKWIAVVAACALVAGCSALYFIGSVVVIDQGARISSVTVLSSDGTSQPLRRLFTGSFVVIPRIEGDLAVHCRDGSRWRGQYVTPHLHIWMKMGSGCTPQR